MNVKNKYPVSVVICTLNEQDNIESCIDFVLRAHPAEIIVVDASEDSRTFDIAKACGVRVFKSELKGKHIQEEIGYQNAFADFVAFIDADDRIEPDFFKKLIFTINRFEVDASQALITSKNADNYWSSSWGKFVSIQRVPQSKIKMLGRPCVVKRNFLLRLSREGRIEFGSEDTNMSIELERLGAISMQSDGVSSRYFPSSFNECRLKWNTYGKGYFYLCCSHPRKIVNIAVHLLWIIPISRPLKLIIYYRQSIFLFSIAYSFFCVRGVFMEFLKCIRSKIFNLVFPAQ